MFIKVCILFFACMNNSDDLFLGHIIQNWDLITRTDYYPSTKMVLGTDYPVLKIDFRYRIHSSETQFLESVLNIFTVGFLGIVTESKSTVPVFDSHYKYHWISKCYITIFYNLIFLTKNLDILRQRTRNIEVKKYCISLLEKYGSFDYTTKTLKELDRQAREEIARLGGNPLLEQVLDGLLNWQRKDQHIWIKIF